MERKFALKSKGFLGGMGALVATLVIFAQQAGVVSDKLTASLNSVIALIGAASSLVAIIGRWVGDQKLTMKRKSD